MTAVPTEATTRPRRRGGSRRRKAGVDVAMSPRGKWVLLAFFVAFLVFLYLPTLLLMIFSFNDSNVTAFPLEGFTFGWYEAAWENGDLRKAFVRSLWVAAAVAGVATTLGALASYALARRVFPGRSVISALILLPLVVPTVVLGVALLVLFRPDAGVLPVPLGLSAVLIGHVVIALPFAVLLILPRIARIDRRLEEAAEDLGASWLQTVRRVVLPLITPAILSSFLVCLVVSIDEVVIASFVAQPQEPTLPVLIYSGLRLGGTIPLLMPVATLLIVLSLLLVLLSVLIRRIGERRLGLVE